MKPRLPILLAAFLLYGCSSDKLGGGTGGTGGGGGGSGGTSAGGSAGTMSSGGSGGGGVGGTTAGGGTGGRPAGVMCTYPESTRCLPGMCGNGVRDQCSPYGGTGIDCSNQFTEWCDGADVGTATCASRGLGTGTLRCTSDCGFDTSGCSGAGGAGGTGGGGSGGTAAACDAIAGTGGTGGVAAGCDLEVARQALVALGIGTVGAASTSTTTLPATLTDAQWSVKSEACREGGYDLTPVAGMNVCLVSQVFTGMCQGNPARVWVLMSNGAVQCVYLALCPGSRIAPGVYSAVNSLCSS